MKQIILTAIMIFSSSALSAKPTKKFKNFEDVQKTMVAYSKYNNIKTGNLQKQIILLVDATNAVTTLVLQQQKTIELLKKKVQSLEGTSSI